MGRRGGGSGAREKVRERWRERGRDAMKTLTQMRGSRGEERAGKACMRGISMVVYRQTQEQLHKETSYCCVCGGENLS